MTDKIKTIIEDACKLGKPDSPEGRMERFDYLLDYILQLDMGNLIEVGCGSGMTTKIMLAAAKKYERKVIAIDPFESDSTMPEGYGGYPFSVFADNTVGYRDQLVLCRHRSLSSYSLDAINANGPIAFAFLDGLQYRTNVLNELRLCAVKNVAVICVDDINRLTDVSQVPLAVRDFMKECDKYEFVGNDLIEGYLVLRLLEDTLHNE